MPTPPMCRQGKRAEHTTQAILGEVMAALSVAQPFPAPNQSSTVPVAKSEDRLEESFLDGEDNVHSDTESGVVTAENDEDEAQPYAERETTGERCFFCPWHNCIADDT